MDEDPLSGLLVRKEELDRAMLAEVLTPYVRLDQNSGAVILRPEFAPLKNEQKVLVYLLSRKAARTLGLLEEGEEASPREIADATGINYDSVKPTVSALFRKRIVQKSDGSYSVPDHAVLTVRQWLIPPKGQ